MRLIDRNDIQTWAEKFNSKGYLPVLISRLVKAITPISTATDFPSGSAVFSDGWDGIVNCTDDCNYVPKGISLWEFGTEAGNTKKASDDYAKRTADPLGFDAKTSTFIFLTPRFWRDKGKWRAEKMKDKIWADIKVYDSRDIEQWLDEAPAVARWFSSQVNKYPFDGILTTEEFWKEWAIGSVGELPPGIVTLGRENESNQLLSFLNSPPNIKGIKATSKDEAIAFIIASAKQFEETHQGIFFSKSLIIDNPTNFRSVRINSRSLNLIARFEELQILFAAVAEGHHVLVPLGPDDTFNQETISLPVLSRDGQISSLISLGISPEDAAKYSLEAARNITVLKRLLKFPQNKVDWAKTENVRDIVPAMLLGRWNENKKGDRDLLETLSGEKYEDYILKIYKWRDISESPFIQIGETWRLTSPLDIWANISAFLLKVDFERLEEAVTLAIKAGNPLVDPENASLGIYFNKEKVFSNWAREGLSQSLILIGLYGSGLEIPNMPSPQTWVDNVIESLLDDASAELWISLDHEMPLIAEASPHSFFNAVNTSLSTESKPIMAVFDEENGFLTPTSHHTGLLWALEGLAWMPEYLLDSCLILTTLAARDPGGKLSNRPINSLSEIFKSWHHQTLASFEERMEVLSAIAEKNIDIAWTLLMGMLPKHHGIAHPTHKMRWRLFGKNTNVDYTFEELWKTHTYVTDLLLSIYDNSEDKFAQLIDESDNLNSEHRRKIFDFAKAKHKLIQQKSYTIWKTIRKTLSHHRSHPNTEWALHKVELQKYEELYYLFEPPDTINKYIWLFDEQWPSFPEGTNHNDQDIGRSHEEQQKRIDNARLGALKEIFSQFGIEKIKDLTDKVGEPWALGDTAAKLFDNDDLIFSVAELLKGNEKNLRFIQSFFYRKSIINSQEWSFTIYEKLKSKGYNNLQLAQFFLSLIQSKALWDYIAGTNQEIHTEYWEKVHPHFYHLTVEEKLAGLNYLRDFKRFFTLIDTASHFAEEIPTQTIVDILKSAATEPSIDGQTFRAYEVGRLFEQLDRRTNVDSNSLIQLEWLYLPYLDKYSTGRQPKLLHEELIRDPSFFIEVIKWVYMPKNRDLIQIEREGLSDDFVMNRSKQAYQLLNNLKKIPGTRADGTIDGDILNKWVSQVRKLAEDVDRLEVTDAQIGYLLAQYPEGKVSIWPPDVISDLIENINTDSLKRNFSSATFNKRGSSSRGPFDGGNIERGHASYFEKLAEAHKKKHPNLTQIFTRLSKGYIEDAKRMDQTAERDKLEY